MEVHPGAPNVIPGHVMVDVEIRAMDNHVLDAAEAALEAKAAGLGGSFATGHHQEPVMPTRADGCHRPRFHRLGPGLHTYAERGGG